MKTIFSSYALAMMFCGVLFFSCAPEIERPQNNSTYSSSSSKLNDNSSSSRYSSSSQQVNNSSSSNQGSSSSSAPPSSSSTETYCLNNDELSCVPMSILPDYGYTCDEWAPNWEISDSCPDDYTIIED